ncbi:MAG: hypothetical protein JRG95_19955 [Deltaproteobacteria bacterium]|nr:hypothetical protein [Deltaproteobacteria bacterium]
MTLTDLGNIGETIGGIAVLVTLAYLALQIRQNTRTMRAASHHSANQLGVQINLALGSNPEVARVLMKGAMETPAPEPHEQLMFHLLMRANFSGAEDFYIQAREGLLEPEMWESRRRSMQRYLHQPGVRTWWERNRDIFSADFAAEFSREK